MSGMCYVNRVIMIFDNMDETEQKNIDSELSI